MTTSHPQVDLLDLDRVLDSPPDQAGEGKFVLITDGQTWHLVVGSVTGYRYHANLVDAFCTGHAIPTAWLKKPDQVEILESRVRVLGGGWIEAAPSRGSVVLHGYSKAYGACDRTTLEWLASSLSRTHEREFKVGSEPAL